MHERERTLGTAAIAGATFFAVTVIGQTLFRSDRSPSRDFVSEYAIGDFGWIQTLGFLVLGLAEFALAYGLWRVAESARTVRVASFLIGVGGVVDVVSAIFPTDLDEAHTTSGRIHNLAGIVGFVAILVAMVLLSRARRADEEWRSTRRVSFLVALLSVIFFILIGAAEEGGWSGIPQRIFILVFLGWYVVLGLQLIRRVNREPLA